MSAQYYLNEGDLSEYCEQSFEVDWAERAVFGIIAQLDTIGMPSDFTAAFDQIHPEHRSALIADLAAIIRLAHEQASGGESC